MAGVHISHTVKKIAKGYGLVFPKVGMRTWIAELQFWKPTPKALDAEKCNTS